MENRDELISYVLLWTPSHERASEGRPTIPYLRQLSKDTGNILKDLLETMDDSHELRESQGNPC